MQAYYRNVSFQKADDEPKYFELSDQLYEMTLVITDNLSKRTLKRAELSLYQIILLFNYYKATNSFLPMVSLCDKGYVGDAKTIC